MKNKTKEIPNKKQKKEYTPNIFFRIGKKIEDIKKVLSYKRPNHNAVVTLKGGKEIKTLKYQKFINEKNFRLQIGKMQKDGDIIGGTIYSPSMLRFGIEYIAEHIELDENGEGKAIIQLWPDLAKCLIQDDAKILSFEEEKKQIKKIINEVLGKKWKNIIIEIQDKIGKIINEVLGEEGKETTIEIRNKTEKIINENLIKKGKNITIEVQNVAENYPDVFDAIKNKGKEGIIPRKEPKLEDFKLPLKSPLPIIRYLAYHYKYDKDLRDIFYKTKPIKYLGQDVQNNRKPGESDSDYYSIVEVGIRLYEILNGISIQGGIGRQRVYDKIISLILFGEDRIGDYYEHGKKGKKLRRKAKKDGRDLNYGEYGVFKTLKPSYKALNNLHDWIAKQKNYYNPIMNLLYIELNKGKLNKIDKKIELKEKLTSKLIKLGTGIALFGALTFGGNDTIKNNEQRNNYNNRADSWTRYNKETRGPDDIGYMAADYCLTYESIQEGVLEAKYDLSEYDYYNKEYLFGRTSDFNEESQKTERKRRLDTCKAKRNKIIDEFRNAFHFYFNMTHGSLLTATEFMDTSGQLIDKYNLSYKKPYEHLKDAKMDAIINTITYGKDINISKCNMKDVKEEKKFIYYIDTPGTRDINEGFYRLKFIQVLINGEYKELVMAAKYDRYSDQTNGDFTLGNGLKCMEDLVHSYPDLFK